MNPKPLDIRCPTCGAAPGERCELSSGQPRTAAHVERIIAAEKGRKPKKLSAEIVGGI